MQLKREDFPTIDELYADKPRRLQTFNEMMDILNQALEEGSIRNAVFKDVKDSAGRICDDSLEYMVKKPFFWGQADNHPQEILDIYYKLYVSGAHSLLSFKKKIDALTIDNECTRAMKKWVNEFIPLTHALESLKPNIVKGRAPSTAPAKPVNPNKDVKTCPCCFRPIAVVASTMAHHGFKRPGQGYQTASCPGIRFRPLEISPDGLHYMLEMHKTAKEQCEKSLADAPNITSFEEHKRYGMKRDPVDITRDDSRFKSYYDNHVHGLETNIRWHTRDIEMFEARIAAWKPDMKHKQVTADDESPTP
ncbi:hypothetical protein [Pseudomonas putida]|uniref:Uncharacterized protein n=1 Tax=Pseudomonas putida TaxID=303 RepID=A0A8I1JIC9_PSEPU|nr:hypothetical protein [Pseudomonas putida]MBI6882384.1 hypothetical protein [Pseudomonas putida]